MSKLYWWALFEAVVQVLATCVIVVALVMVVGVIISLVFA